MSRRITRRRLLGGGIKAGVGLATWNLAPSLTVGLLPRSASGASPDDQRFRAAFARLDEFIAAHLRDMGAPGMTLALATRDGSQHGLLRASTYGFADMKAGLLAARFDLRLRRHESRPEGPAQHVV